MKCRFEAEYRAFTGKWNLLIHLLLFSITCLICYATSGMIWQLSVMICPLLSMMALCFMDYFAFAGTNSKQIIYSAPSILTVPCHECDHYSHFTEAQSLRHS